MEGGKKLCLLTAKLQNCRYNILYINCCKSNKLKGFSFQNNSKILNPSEKMDLDFGAVFKGKKNPAAQFHQTDLEVLGNSREVKIVFYSKIFTFSMYLLKSPIANH